MSLRVLSVCFLTLVAVRPVYAAPPDSCDPRENFKWLIAQPEVNQHLKELLDETVSANPGKSKDEVMAIFEQKKKEYGATLKVRAKQSVPATCPRP